MGTSGCCKLYPEQHRVWDYRLARPSPRGGWNPGAILGLDRVYSTPMFPWGGCALTTPFHPYLAGTSQGAHTPNEAVSFCCTCPRVTPGGRYPLSLPCGARTFLTGGLSASPRGCPTWLRGHCTAFPKNCQSFSLAAMCGKLPRHCGKGKCRCPE